MSRHDGHERCEMVAVSGRYDDSGRLAAWLLCPHHAVVVRSLPICGVPRADGGSCRGIVREDRGPRFTTCSRHAPPKRRAS